VRKRLLWAIEEKQIKQMETINTKRFMCNSSQELDQRQQLVKSGLRQDQLRTEERLVEGERVLRADPSLLQISRAPAAKHREKPHSRMSLLLFDFLLER
jgi:hypothetical protein